MIVIGASYVMGHKYCPMTLLLFLASSASGILVHWYPKSQHSGNAVDQSTGNVGGPVNFRNKYGGNGHRDENVAEVQDHVYRQHVHEDVQKTVTIVKEVAVPYPVETAIHYPVEKRILYPIEVPVPEPYAIEKEIPFPVKVLFKVPIRIPKPIAVRKEVRYPVAVPVNRPVPVKVYVPKPFPVEKKIHYEVKIPVPKPFPIERPVPIPIQIPEHVPQLYPMEKVVHYPVEVRIERPAATPITQTLSPVYVENPILCETEKPVPVPIKTEMEGTMYTGTNQRISLSEG